MHGRMQPFTLDHCRNITLKNFSVDWEIPLTAQGIVTQSTSEYLEIEIDSHQYPYIIENKRLTFVGEGWKSSLWAHPEDEDALAFFREKVELRKEALKQYAEQYGPLTIDTANDRMSRSFEWVMQPGKARDNCLLME